MKNLPTQWKAEKENRAIDWLMRDVNEKPPNLIGWLGGKPTLYEKYTDETTRGPERVEVLTHNQKLYPSQLHLLYIRNVNDLPKNIWKPLL